VSYAWVRVPNDDMAHYVHTGHEITMCGGHRAGDPWPGEPRVASLDDPGQRCGSCITAKMVANGEIRMVTRGRTGGISPESNPTRT
jgi:hypothetical protein